MLPYRKPASRPYRGAVHEVSSISLFSARQDPSDGVLFMAPFWTVTAINGFLQIDDELICLAMRKPATRGVFLQEVAWIGNLEVVRGPPCPFIDLGEAQEH